MPLTRLHLHHSGVRFRQTGLVQDGFAEKQPAWWVALAATVTALDEEHDLHGVPIWLRDDGQRVAAYEPSTTSRLLVDGHRLPAFAYRHDLFDLLHPAFDSEQGRSAVAWLKDNAAYSRYPGNEAQLLAFAQKYGADPQAVDDETLHELKALLDPVTGPR